jgi:hypothetical protein
MSAADMQYTRVEPAELQRVTLLVAVGKKCFWTEA